MKFFASLFKRDELQRRGITIDEEVGHGTYSKVYKGRLRRSEEVSTARRDCPGSRHRIPRSSERPGTS